MIVRFRALYPVPNLAAQQPRLLTEDEARAVLAAKGLPPEKLAECFERKEFPRRAAVVP
jgi:hypothetical protein